MTEKFYYSFDVKLHSSDVTLFFCEKFSYWHDVKLYYSVVNLYFCDVELYSFDAKQYSCNVILYWHDVNFNFNDMELYSTKNIFKTHNQSHRKGKSTFADRYTSTKTQVCKRAFPFPLFPTAKKRINFPPLKCKTQNLENK